MQLPTKEHTATKKGTIVGILVLMLVVAIGLTGCGSQSATASQATTANQANSGQTNPRQAFRNPAIQAAMQIRRLQNNAQQALSSAQKDKLKPILQTLIKTANPSQAFLQQQAAAINAVFTASQKSSLTQTKGFNPGGPNRSDPNGSTPPTDKGQGGSRGFGNRGSFQPQQIYQQILASLN